MSKFCSSCIHHDACAFWVGEGFDKFNRAESCKFYEQKETETKRCCDCSHFYGCEEDHTKRPCKHFEKSYLPYMKDYPIERDVFCKIVDEVLGVEKFMYFLAYHGYNVSDLDDFNIFRYEDEFYILHKPSGVLVNWYKHLGRCLGSNALTTEEGFRKFFEALKYDLGDRYN